MGERLLWLSRRYYYLLLLAVLVLAGMFSVYHSSSRAASEGRGAGADVPAPGSVAFGSGFVTIAGEGGSRQIQVEVARTAEQLKMGLMNRDDLPADQGMLFMFPGESASAFYMLNTEFPLSVAFIDRNDAIISIMPMQPCAREPCQRYRPDQPYVMALEMNQGWFAEHGVAVGDRVDSVEIRKWIASDAASP